MATSKKRKAPTVEKLRGALDEALADLAGTKADGSAAAALKNAAAMIQVWSLRFQIAAAAYEDAVASGDDKERARASQGMTTASSHLELWERRRSVAQDDLVNDLLIAEKEHTAEQDELADEARQLQ